MGRYIEEDANGNRYIVDDGQPDISQPPPFAQQDQLGPDYNQSVLAQVPRAIGQFPAAIGQTYNDTKDLLSAPIETLANAGVEKSARTVGNLASGTAGMMVGAPVGAELGAWTAPVTGPFGPLIGGILGGGIGFGAGLLGFNKVTDAATGDNANKTESDYLKDLVYNSTQGALGDAAFKAVGAPIKAVKSKISGNGWTGGGSGGMPKAERAVVAELQKLSPDISPEQIQQALDARATDPLLQHKSLGEILGNDALKNAQRTIEMNDSNSYSVAKQARDARATAELQYLNNIEQSSATPLDTQSALQGLADQQLSSAQAGVDAAQAPIEPALQSLPGKIAPDAAGNLIRNNVQEGLQAQEKLVRSFAGQMGSGNVDPSFIQATAQQEIGKYFREYGAQPDSPLNTLMEQLNKQPEPVTNAAGSPLLDASGNPISQPSSFNIKDAQALSSKAIAIVKGSDARSAAVAGQIVNAIDKAVQQAKNAGTITPDQYSAWRDMVQARKTQGAIWEHSRLPNKGVLKREYSGQPTIVDSAVPQKYFRPNGAGGAGESVQNYIDGVGDAPNALDPLYQYAATSFREQAAPNGVINPKAMRQWIANHSEALDKLPVLKEQLSNLDKAQTMLNEKLGNLKQTEAEIQKGALKLWLDGANPDAVIQQVISSKDITKNLINLTKKIELTKDPNAIAGLRRGIIEQLKLKTFIPNEIGGVDEALSSQTQFNGTMRTGTLADEIRRIRPALEKANVFTKSQLDAFDQLYSSARSKLSVQNAKAPNDPGTAQNISTLGALVRAGGKAWLKALPAGKYVTVLEKILSAIPQSEYVSKLENAIYNPAYARDLLQKATTKNFIKSAETIYKDNITAALGAAAKSAPTAEVNARMKMKPPSQQRVTAKTTFPEPKDLLQPPASGELKKKSAPVPPSISQETRATIAIESNGNPDAVSPKGARGLMQIMPDTAKWIAKKLGEKYTPITPGMTQDERKASIEQNIRFGEWYKQYLLDKFNGNQVLARAAYNAGPQRIMDAMKAAGTTTDVEKILSKLPDGVKSETIPYVMKLAKAYGNS